MQRTPERAAYEKKWGQKNAARKAATNRAWREANAEQIKAKKRAHYEANAASILAAKRGNHKPLSPEQAARKEDRRLQRLTGFTVAELKNQLERQGWSCAICARDLKGLARRLWHADHCHTTGSPRGVLCGPCNMALGLFKDDTTRLQAAISYLQNPPAVRA